VNDAKKQALSGLLRTAAAAALLLVAAPPALPQTAAHAGTGTHRKRVVSLTPTVTETLFAVGAGESVVGVSDYCDEPPAVRSLPHVGSFLEPVVEVVVHLQPDLVITSRSPGNEAPVRAIERTGIEVGVVSEGSESIADTRTAILETAALVGRENEGRKLVADIDAGLAAVAARVRGRERPSVALVVGYEPLVLAGPASCLGELVELAGGRNVAATAGGQWPRMGWEFLLASAPEVIIDTATPHMDESDSDHRSHDDAALEGRWGRYTSLPAVRTGRVHAVEGTALLHPGPRLAKAARLLSRLIQPEAWKDEH
jgi:iron complex transport system substrate-binding protein